ncbi:MAG TPA: SpoIID/LytB domain-containing protein, partial [Polyangiaceae bacterium]|nr:SpoIID/LytB domain-containing protein [Polyangiaceae bacterium]
DSTDRSSASATEQAATPSTVWIQPQNNACADTSGPVQVSFESGYIAGVVAAETGFLCSAFGLSSYACLEHYRAQAVAARTYVTGHMQGDPALGTRSKPIPASPCFQAWSSSPNATEVNAATSTAGVVMTHNGQILAANYDAGGYAFDSNGNPQPPRYYYGNSPFATWAQARAACCGSSDPSNCVFPGDGDPTVWTQIYVTDNNGQSGGGVAGTCQASPGGGNRGALGQNWSAELALRWVDGSFTYKDILRFFYGADVTIGGSAPPPPRGANGVGNASGNCTTAEYNAQQNGVASYWTCQGNSRYVCDGQDHKVVEACPSGCISEGAGVDDQCNGGGGPTCTSAEYAAQNLNGASYWTCQGNARFMCDGKGYKITEACSRGCISEGAGADDQCR